MRPTRVGRWARQAELPSKSFFVATLRLKRAHTPVHILRLQQRKYMQFSATSRVCERPRSWQVARAHVIAILVVISHSCSTALQHAGGLAVWGYSLWSRIVEVGYPKGGAHHGGGMEAGLDLPYYLLVCSCDLYAYNW